VAGKVYRDAWGIPHLRGDDALELAFLQGRNAAIDRAWQIELGRRRSEGTSAAFLGPSALPWDRFARQARLDDTARRCYNGLLEATKAWVSAYVDGVNDGLAHGADGAPEFAATNLTPGRWEPWSPLGVWLAVNVLFSSFPSKLWREQVAQHLGRDSIDLFAIEGPGTAGSNGWLVEAERTASGAPILAGDPHRLIENPGVYQQIRLACPEYDVLGLAVPGVPGIPHFGHTGPVAWAITNAMADGQDLYAERLRRIGENVEAEGPDGWDRVHSHFETIEVAGQEAVQVEVIETARGPVVVGGPDDARAVSLRHPPRVVGSIGFDTLPGLLHARTVGDVDAALDSWVEPVNVVLAADTSGGTLHRAAGRVPDRHDENSLTVVPGWIREHEWRGWKEMPREEVRGIAVMANARGLAEPLGRDFAPPHRARRIRELLESRPIWTVDDMPLIHTDTYLGSAEQLLTWISRLDGLSEQAARVRDQLLAWDRRMDAGSTDAATYAALRSEVVRRLAARPSLARLDDLTAFPEVFHLWTGLVPRIAYALENLLVRDGIQLTDVLREALDETALATEPWGQRHRLMTMHAFTGSAKGEAYRSPDVGLSGDNDCVLATSSVGGATDICMRGPVARYVWDLARREDSRWIVPLGASGVPGDPHQQDQLPLWVRGELAPVVTDWEQLTEETQHA
jgi:penicillin amidase